MRWSAQQIHQNAGSGAGRRFLVRRGPSLAEQSWRQKARDGQSPADAQELAATADQRSFSRLNRQHWFKPLSQKFRDRSFPFMIARTGLAINPKLRHSFPRNRRRIGCCLREKRHSHGVAQV
jgi:hypothetical protein